jgi:hypothetical protein
MITRTSPRPGSLVLASRNATGIPAMIDTAVAAAACATVNPTSCHTSALASVSSTPPSRRPSRRIATTGHTKKTARNPNGTNAISVRPLGVVLSPARSRATR